MNSDDPQPNSKYKWPYYVLGAVILGVILAVLWMAREVIRTQRIQRVPSSSWVNPGNGSNSEWVLAKPEVRV